MTDGTPEDHVLEGEESRRMARAASLILTGLRPEVQILVSIVLSVVLILDALLGTSRHSLIVAIGFGAVGVAMFVGSALYRRPYPLEQREAALATLARCSDPTALRELMAFVHRQDWSPEETARLTARHLPMARRAIERGRGPLPKGLARWIGALREGGVVSEDLDEIARRIDASLRS